MGFWDILWSVVMFSVLAIIVFFMIGWIAAMIGEFNAGMHGLDLAYKISEEDRESLSKEDYQKTKKMTPEELTTFLSDRFPNSVPETAACKCEANVSTNEFFLGLCKCGDSNG